MKEISHLNKTQCGCQTLTTHHSRFPKQLQQWTGTVSLHDLLTDLGPTTESWFDDLTAEHEHQQSEITPNKRQAGWSPCPAGGVVSVSASTPCPLKTTFQCHSPALWSSLLPHSPVLGVDTTTSSSLEDNDDNNSTAVSYGFDLQDVESTDGDGVGNSRTAKERLLAFSMDSTHISWTSSMATPPIVPMEKFPVKEVEERQKGLARALFSPNTSTHSDLGETEEDMTIEQEEICLSPDASHNAPPSAEKSVLPEPACPYCRHEVNADAGPGTKSCLCQGPVVEIHDAELGDRKSQVDRKTELGDGMLRSQSPVSLDLLPKRHEEQHVTRPVKRVTSSLKDAVLHSRVVRPSRGYNSLTSTPVRKTRRSVLSQAYQLDPLVEEFELSVDPLHDKQGDRDSGQHTSTPKMTSSMPPHFAPNPVNQTPLSRSFRASTRKRATPRNLVDCFESEKTTRAVEEALADFFSSPETEAKQRRQAPRKTVTQGENRSDAATRETDELRVAQLEAGLGAAKLEIAVSGTSGMQIGDREDTPMVSGLSLDLRSSDWREGEQTGCGGSVSSDSADSQACSATVPASCTHDGSTSEGRVEVSAPDRDTLDKEDAILLVNKPDSCSSTEGRETSPDHCSSRGPALQKRMGTDALPNTGVYIRESSSSPVVSPDTPNHSPGTPLSILRSSGGKLRDISSSPKRVRFAKDCVMKKLSRDTNAKKSLIASREDTAGTVVQKELHLPPVDGTVKDKAVPQGKDDGVKLSEHHKTPVTCQSTPYNMPRFQQSPATLCSPPQIVQATVTSNHQTCQGNPSGSEKRLPDVLNLRPFSDETPLSPAIKASRDDKGVTRNKELSPSNKSEVCHKEWPWKDAAPAPPDTTVPTQRNTSGSTVLLPHDKIQASHQETPCEKNLFPSSVTERSHEGNHGNQTSTVCDQPVPSQTGVPYSETHASRDTAVPIHKTIPDSKLLFPPDKVLTSYQEIHGNQIPAACDQRVPSDTVTHGNKASSDTVTHSSKALQAKLHLGLKRKPRFLYPTSSQIMDTCPQQVYRFQSADTCGQPPSCKSPVMDTSAESSTTADQKPAPLTASPDESSASTYHVPHLSGPPHSPAVPEGFIANAEIAPNVSVANTADVTHLDKKTDDEDISGSGLKKENYCLSQLAMSFQEDEVMEEDPDWSEIEDCVIDASDGEALVIRNGQGREGNLMDQLHPVEDCVMDISDGEALLISAGQRMEGNGTIKLQPVESLSAESASEKPPRDKNKEGSERGEVEAADSFPGACSRSQRPVEDLWGDRGCSSYTQHPDLGDRGLSSSTHHPDLSHPCERECPAAIQRASFQEHSQGDLLHGMDFSQELLSQSKADAGFEVAEEQDATGVLEEVDKDILLEMTATNQRGLESVSQVMLDHPEAKEKTSQIADNASAGESIQCKPDKGSVAENSQPHQQACAEISQSSFQEQPEHIQSYSQEHSGAVHIQSEPQGQCNSEVIQSKLLEQSVSESIPSNLECVHDMDTEHGCQEQDHAALLLNTSTYRPSLKPVTEGESMGRNYPRRAAVSNNSTSQTTECSFFPVSCQPSPTIARTSLGGRDSEPSLKPISVGSEQSASAPHLVSIIKADQNAFMSGFCGFKTASGREFSVSVEGERKAGEMWKAVEKELQHGSGTPQPGLPEDIHMTHAASDGTHESQSTGKTRIDRNVEDLREAAAFSTANCEEKTSALHGTSPQMPKSSGGFRTAGGKSISLSSKAQQQAVALWESVGKDLRAGSESEPLHHGKQHPEVTTALTAANPEKQKSSGGFRTAGGKSINLSSEAQQQAMALWESVGKDFSAGSESLQRGQQPPEIPTLNAANPDSGGYKTPGGKSVNLSSKAQQHALALWESDGKNLSAGSESEPVNHDKHNPEVLTSLNATNPDRSEGFQTAGRKSVNLSIKAQQQAMALWESVGKEFTADAESLNHGQKHSELIPMSLTSLDDSLSSKKLNDNEKPVTKPTQLALRLLPPSDVPQGFRPFKAPTVIRKLSEDDRCQLRQPKQPGQVQKNTLLNHFSKEKPNEDGRSWKQRHSDEFSDDDETTWDIEMMDGIERMNGSGVDDDKAKLKAAVAGLTGSDAFNTESSQDKNAGSQYCGGFQSELKLRDAESKFVLANFQKRQYNLSIQSLVSNSVDLDRAQVVKISEADEEMSEAVLTELNHDLNEATQAEWVQSRPGEHLPEKHNFVETTQAKRAENEPGKYSPEKHTCVAADQLLVQKNKMCGGNTSSSKEENKRNQGPGLCNPNLKGTGQSGDTLQEILLQKSPHTVTVAQSDLPSILPKVPGGPQSVEENASNFVSRVQDPAKAVREHAESDEELDIQSSYVDKDTELNMSCLQSSGLDSSCAEVSGGVVWMDQHTTSTTQPESTHGTAVLSWDAIKEERDIEPEGKLSALHSELEMETLLSQDDFDVSGCYKEADSQSAAGNMESHANISCKETSSPTAERFGTSEKVRERPKSTQLQANTSAILKEHLSCSENLNGQNERDNMNQSTCSNDVPGGEGEDQGGMDTSPENSLANLSWTDMASMLNPSQWDEATGHFNEANTEQGPGEARQESSGQGSREAKQENSEQDCTVPTLETGNTGSSNQLMQSACSSFKKVNRTAENTGEVFRGSEEDVKINKNGLGQDSGVKVEHSAGTATAEGLEYNRHLSTDPEGFHEPSGLSQFFLTPMTQAVHQEDETGGGRLTAGGFDSCRHTSNSHFGAESPDHASSQDRRQFLSPSSTVTGRKRVSPDREETGRECIAPIYKRCAGPSVSSFSKSLGREYMTPASRSATGPHVSPVNRIVDGNKALARQSERTEVTYPEVQENCNRHVLQETQGKQQQASEKSFEEVRAIFSDDSEEVAGYCAAQSKPQEKTVNFSPVLTKISGSRVQSSVTGQDTADEDDGVRPPDRCPKETGASLTSGTSSGFGFQTASGKSVSVSEASRDKVKRMFRDEEDLLIKLPAMVLPAGSAAYTTANDSKATDSWHAASHTGVLQETNACPTPALDTEGISCHPLGDSEKNQSSANFSNWKGEDTKQTEKVSSSAGAFPGFQTARGSSVSISKKALKLAEEVLEFSQDRLSLPGSGKDQSESVEKNQDQLSASGTFPGFQTARGIKVSVSNDALIHARNFFTSDDACGMSKNGQSNTEQTVPGSTGFLTADVDKEFEKPHSVNAEVAGHSQHSSTSENRISSFTEGSPSKLRWDVQGKGSVSQDHANSDHLHHDTDVSRLRKRNKTEHDFAPPHQKFQGFLTAGGKAVGVSDNALKNARKVLDGASTSDPADSILAASDEVSRLSGFQTASGAHVSVSHKALQHARETLWSDADADTMQAADLKASKPNMSGFQTARGESVSVSHKALQHARETLWSDSDADTMQAADLKASKPNMSGFQTARGESVSVSHKALQHARETLCSDGDADVMLPTGQKESKPSVSGFQTARGESVSVSHKALQHARETFHSDEDADVMLPTGQKESKPSVSGFQTARGGSVSVSHKALQHAQSLFKDDTPTSSHLPSSSHDPVAASEMRGLASSSPEVSSEVHLAAMGSVCSLSMSSQISITESAVVSAFSGLSSNCQAARDSRETGLPMGKQERKGKECLQPIVSDDSQLLVKGREQADLKGEHLEKDAGQRRQMVKRSGIYTDSEAILHDRPAKRSRLQPTTGYQHEVSPAIAPHPQNNNRGLPGRSTPSFQPPYKKAKFTPPSTRHPSTSVLTPLPSGANPPSSVPEVKPPPRIPAFKPPPQLPGFRPPPPAPGFKPPPPAPGVRPVSAASLSGDNSSVRFRGPRWEERTPECLPKQDVSLDEITRVEKDQPAVAQRPHTGLERSLLTSHGESAPGMSGVDQLALGRQHTHQSEQEKQPVGQVRQSADESVQKENLIGRSEEARQHFEKDKQPIGWNRKRIDQSQQDKENSDQWTHDDSTGSEEARMKQEKIIRDKKRRKVVPVRGRWLSQKTSQPQTSLEEVLQATAATRTSKRKLLSWGVSAAVCAVSSRSAQDFKFYLPAFYPARAPGVLVGDGALLVADHHGYVGRQEFYTAFLTMDGVDPGLVTEAWVHNHYRWIVWKLASYEVARPHHFGSRALTPDVVMFQLKYRYDREVDNCQRSAVKRVVERDDTACKRLVLCVSDIMCLSPGMKMLEVTDGWYSLPCKPDPALQDLIDRQKLVVGQKIVTSGAELAGSQEASSPLELCAGLHLKVFGNSTRPAPARARLGYQHCPTPLCVPLSTLHPQGGLVGCVEVLVVKKHPLMVMEKSSEGGCVFRSLAMEEKARQHHEDQRQRTMEKLCSQLQEQMDREEEDARRASRRGSRALRLTQQKVQSLTTGAEICEAMDKAGQPEDFMGMLSGSQIERLLEYRQRQQEERQQQLNQRLQEAMQQSSQMERTVVPVQKLMVSGCCRRDLEAKTRLMVTVWRPGLDWEAVQEGKRYRMYSLTATQARGRDTPGEKVELTAGRQSRLQAVSCRKGAALDPVSTPKEMLDLPASFLDMLMAPLSQEYTPSTTSPPQKSSFNTGLPRGTRTAPSLTSSNNAGPHAGSRSTLSPNTSFNTSLSSSPSTVGMDRKRAVQVEKLARLQAYSSAPCLSPLPCNVSPALNRAFKPPTPYRK